MKRIFLSPKLLEFSLQAPFWAKKVYGLKSLGNDLGKFNETWNISSPIPQREQRFFWQNQIYKWVKHDRPGAA